MIRFSRQSFKWRTTLLIAAAISIILLLALSFVYFTFKGMEERNEKQLLKLRIEQFVDSLRKDPRRAIASFAEDLERDQYIRIRDGTGRILYEKGFHFPAEWLPTVDPTTLRKEDGSQEDEYRSNGKRIFFAVVQGKNVSQGQPMLMIELYENAQKLMQLTKFMRNLLLFSGIGGIVFAAAISYFVASASIRPVGNITRRIREMDVNALHQRIPLPKSKDELFEMTVTLNGLLNRIDHGFQQQKQFVADASHELRTPLTIIEGHANMIRRWGRTSPAVIDESLAYILQESNRLRLLTDQLLQVAMLDEGDNPSDPGEIEPPVADAVEVVQSVTKQAGLLHSGIPVRELFGDTPVPVRISEADLRQAVLNVVHNAIKFTPVGGEVLVTLAVDADHANLEVRDTGIGIAEDELPHLFERFYRADRSRNRESGGSGLGLAITKQLVERAGGTINIDSEPGVGTTVTIRLLLSPASDLPNA
ncbi:sensor histidine kinase [Paenibacillus cymbidii]|uniref:sensor histidine kinase n=1 Tax=Paenibacillus cymbidii TaxID=1639034 RepID=UPI0010801F22|nr:ATP-binding protein [Paenibacillus cymbidii]